MDELFLDTESGGFDPNICGCVEIAIVRGDGSVVLNTLVDPMAPIPPEATAIHGITDAMVIGMPTMAHLYEAISAMVRLKRVVIYNAAFDVRFVPALKNGAGEIACAMLAAQDAMRLTRWPKLHVAAEWAGHRWEGAAHRALADAQASRTVWRKCRGEA